MAAAVHRLFLIPFFRFRGGSEVILSDSGFILLSLLTGAAATDIFRGRILNLWLLPAAATGFLIHISGRGSAWGPAWKTGAAAVLALLACYLIRAVGAGDVKLLLTASLFLPAEGFLRLVVSSFVIAAAFAVLALVSERRRGIRIPFAPSVLIAYLALC